jgi:hypothetical protein
VTDTAGNPVRQVRTTFTEVVRPGDQLHRFCNDHTGGGSVPATLRTLTDTPPPLTIAGRDTAGEPVAVQSPTVIGDDPYRSERPALRAKVVGEDLGDAVRGAPVIAPTKLGSEKAEIKLPPPPPLKFD